WKRTAIVFDMRCWRARSSGPSNDTRHYLTTTCRPTSPAIGSVFLKTTLLLDDITLVSNAICTNMFAKAFDMNVRTFGSLLLKLSHHRNGLSTQPPSKLGMLPSKLPRYPPKRSTSCCVLQHSCPVRTPLAGMPTKLKLIASVPWGEKNSWFFPWE